MLRPSVYARLAAGLAIVAVALAAMSIVPGADADEPVITYIYPRDGDVFSEPLQVIQICFEEPIDVRDLPPRDEGDFQFTLQRPGGLNVGMRIVFQGNGYGVAVYPGIIDEGFEGEWTLSYTVRDAESLEPVSGVIRWEVEAGGQPIITPTPQMCPTEGTPIPEATATPDPDATPSPTPEPGLDEDNGGPDVLKISLYTIGAAGGALLIAFLGYFLRQRFGFWLHRPPDEPPPDHH